ncbi:MAG: hypothetical protein J3Q66DRAFT_408313 [Benniella sp.]|nr:MAG: hypothetical protein J3Q66DRAFT_408313 [Benniella sp.]
MYFDPALFKIQFRRRSETGKFATLRWTYIVVSILLYFSVSVIQDLAKRDYIYVQHLIYITGHPLRLPDLLVCTANATLTDYDRMVFNYTSYPIKGPTVPAGEYVRSPCLLPGHDTVYNFRFNFKDGQELPKKNLDEILRNITFTTRTSTTAIQFTLIHRQSNIYAERVSFSNDIPDSRGEENGYASQGLDDTVYNNHYAQSGTTTYINSRSIFVRRLRGDILGYFNIHGVDEIFDPQVTSTIEAVPSSPGKTVLVMIIPMTVTEEVETLVMSIGDAFGTWGGVLSLAASFYYFLFGTGKMTPFGYAQRFLLRRGTKRIIKRDYADEDKCSLDPIDVKEKGQHTQYLYQPPTGVAPFWSASIYQMLDQRDPSRSDVQTEDINGTEILRQLQEQRETIALLRTAQEDLLQRLKQHEARSRHSEHLIKGFYLDMGLVEEALERPETIQSTSITIAHHL